MGARLVSLALVRWSQVSDRAFRVLVRMALTALDEPANGTPAGLYFGGRELLALTLRHERGGDRDAAYRTVKRAIAELIAAGAIERTNAARAGQNQVYALRLDSTPRIDTGHGESASQGDTSGPPQGDTNRPPQGDTNRPPQGDTSGPSRGTPAAPPRNHEEPVEELCKEMEKLDLRTAVTVPGDSTPDQEPDFTDEEKPRLRLVTDADLPPPRPVVGSRRWSSRGQDAIAEAMARRAAARKAHHDNAREASNG